MLISIAILQKGYLYIPPIRLHARLSWKKLLGEMIIATAQKNAGRRLRVHYSLIFHLAVTVVPKVVLGDLTKVNIISLLPDGSS